MSRLVS